MQLGNTISYINYSFPLLSRKKGTLTKLKQFISTFWVARYHFFSNLDAVSYLTYPAIAIILALKSLSEEKCFWLRPKYVFPFLPSISSSFIFARSMTFQIVSKEALFQTQWVISFDHDLAKGFDWYSFVYQRRGKELVNLPKHLFTSNVGRKGKTSHFIFYVWFRGGYHGYFDNSYDGTPNNWLLNLNEAFKANGWYIWEIQICCP